MRIYYVFFTGMIFICSLISTAQNTNPLDKQYTPSDESLFGPNQKKTPSSGFENSKKPLNMVKLPLAELMRSEVSLKYEIRLSSHISATAMVGVPFGTDLCEKTWVYLNEVGNGGYDSGQEFLPLSVVQESSSFESGLLYFFSLKYYTQEEDNASVFYELGYKDVKRNYRIFNNLYTTKDYSDEMKYASLSVGTLWVNGKNGVKFTHEASFGVGFKVVYWDTFTEKKYQDQSNNMYLYSEYNKNQEQTFYNGAYLTLRYSIGFGW